MPHQQLEVRTVSPYATHTHTIILLHKEGQTADEFAAKFFTRQVRGKGLPDLFPHVKWVFPQAPWCPDAATPQWYSTTREWESETLQTSLDGLQEVVLNELAYVPFQARIFLGGMGEGCDMALYALLKIGAFMGGFVGLGGVVPRFVRRTWRTRLTKWTPVFLGHDVEYWCGGSELNEWVEAQGLFVESHVYPWAARSEEATADLVGFLKCAMAMQGGWFSNPEVRGEVGLVKQFDLMRIEEADVCMVGDEEMDWKLDALDIRFRGLSIDEIE